MLTAPAAEVPRKPRRVGDDDLADMVMLRAYTFVCGTNRSEWIDGSAEGESKGLHARIEKLDLEQAIGDGLGLADQLIQSLFADRTDALVVDVDAVRSARRLSIEAHAKPHGSPWRGRSHDEMEIAGMKAIGDPPATLVQRAAPLFMVQSPERAQ